MFSFKHPTPVDDAAALLLPVEAALEIGTPLAALSKLDALPFSLHFLVRYTLVEYMAFMWQHAGWLVRRRRVGGMQGAWLRCKSTFTAALHFILLRRGSRTYEMTIDAHGIVRVSDRGVTLIGWDDVRLIRRYREGFLMILKRGTLPIPYRCLSEGEIAELRTFATTLRRA